MRRLGGSGLILAGIFLILGGILLRSSIVEWILDLSGIVAIIIGAVIGIIGLFQLFMGGGRKSSKYGEF
ncbi:MAG: hypothetical protein L0177_13315 [Chloroflexi bacterium]|nr:hypothetical protein [Chloroflexota bacterium]